MAVALDAVHRLNKPQRASVMGTVVNELVGGRSYETASGWFRKAPDHRQKEND